MNNWSNKTWLKLFALVAAQAIVLAVSISIYTNNRERINSQERAAIEKVNSVCDKRGGIDDADEEDRSWEVRCENDKTFIISKYDEEE